AGVAEGDAVTRADRLHQAAGLHREVAGPAGNTDLQRARGRKAGGARRAVADHAERAVAARVVADDGADAAREVAGDGGDAVARGAGVDLDRAGAGEAGKDLAGRRG